MGSTLTTFALAGGVSAHEYYAAFFRIVHPWALPTASRSSVAKVYLRFDKISGDDRLISASSSFAGSVKIIDALGKDVASIELCRGTILDLQPRGMHLEMDDLSLPFHCGQSYPLTLVFDKSGSIDTEVSIGGQ
jgi:periplasmic copper chaperone A